MHNINKDTKAAILWFIILCSFIFFIPAFALLVRNGFEAGGILLFGFFFYDPFWLASVIIFSMLVDHAISSTFIKNKSKIVIITRELIRGGFLTFTILLFFLIFISSKMIIIFGEEATFTKISFVGLFFFSFLGTLLFYFFYEKFNYQRKAFKLAKKSDEIELILRRKIRRKSRKQLKWMFRKKGFWVVRYFFGYVKPIKINEIPDLREYKKYRKELLNIYEILGTVTTAALLFTSIYTSFNTNSFEYVDDFSNELEFLLLLIFMPVYIQTVYYKLPLNFLDKQKEKSE
ncbi:hypothetical protein [Planococcus versutus]|uniref:Uncharacterized protein n=1 Tax=Planococcus versutus TaxID=1302659 RepID=A0A1B1S2Z9_9BACL|nr:hypothetical protein [Planococcus versutus]ANU27561.1 hypothetical protein I858_011245 [Planococcus versutus]